MIHGYMCKVFSRAHRISQLTNRFCKAEYRSAGLQYRRDLRKAISELMVEIDARCDALPVERAATQRDDS